MVEREGSNNAVPARLQIASDDTPDGAVLRLSGELDIASAPALEQALETIGDAPSGRLLLDLSALSFMDSTGLRALLQARQRASETDLELTLRHGPRQVQRVFELSGTIDTFTFED